MRVGINEVVIHDRSSGTRQRELNTLPTLLHCLDEQQFETFVYLASDLSEDLLTRLAGNHPQKCRIVRTPIPSLPTYARVIRGLPYWRQRVNADGLDVLHTAYYPIPAVDLPVILTVNDLRFLHLPDTYTRSRRLFLKTVVASSVRRAKRIIAISQDTKNDLVKHFGVRETSIDVVYIPVDPRFDSNVSGQAVAEVRRTYGLPEKYILYVGHLEPRKNLERLVRAYVSLREAGEIEHALVILGKRSFGFEVLLERIHNSVLASEIHLTGYVEDRHMPAVVADAALLAFPSLHEGFGIPVLEAMACGTPVLTSNVSALPEIAGDAAVLVDPYDVTDIAEGMARILNDRALQERLVEKGLARARMFGAEQAAAGIVDVYRKALSNR